MEKFTKYISLNKLLVFIFIIACFINIIYASASMTILYQEGSSFMIRHLNAIGSGFFQCEFSERYILDLLVSAPVYLLGLFIKNKNFLIYFCNFLWLFLPLIILFQSYKLSIRSGNKSVCFFNLFVYIFGILYFQVYTAANNVLPLSLMLFMLLFQYISSEIKYSVKDLLIIGLLTVVQFASSNMIIVLGPVLGLYCLLSLKNSSDTQKVLKTLIAPCILFASINTFFLSYRFTNYIYDNLFNDLFSVLTTDYLELLDYYLIVVSLILFVYLFFCKYKFNFKTILVILLLLFFSIFGAVANPVNLDIGDIRFFNFLTQCCFSVCSIFFILYAIFQSNDIWKKFFSKIEKFINYVKTELMIKEKNLELLIKSIIAIFSLEVVLLVLTKFANIEVIIPFVLILCVFLYMLIDFRAVCKSEDPNVKEDFLFGSCRVMFFFDLYFIYALFTMSDIIVKTIVIVSLIVVTITYFLLNNFFSNEGDFKNAISENVKILVLLSGIAIAALQLFYTYWWSKNLGYVQDIVNNYESSLYIPEDHEDILDYNKLRGFIYDSNRFLVLSVLLSNDKQVKTLITPYVNNNNCYSAFSEIQDVSEDAIFVPWITLNKKNSFWDITDVSEKLLEYKKNIGM